jgi:hypothetical protein
MSTIGVTAKLEYESGSGWEQVANCKSINFPSTNVSSIDTTHLGLTDFAMTFAPGMVDAGSITFSASFSESSYTALQSLLREVIGWRVTGPLDEAALVTCDGFLTKCDVAMSPNEEVMIEGEIKMTGLPA